jgi:hypothetical protein
MNSSRALSASFRDPSGFLYRRDGVLYRQVNLSYQPHYDLLMQSGLYERLVKARMLIPHQEVALEPELPELHYRTLQPQPVPVISYPYEWSFSQLKDAALLTLRIQKKAVEAGMTLKDASAYNIQFIGCRPVLIDTLSFETYREGEPWVAYRQFCQHFLAPLALMALRDVRLNSLLRIYIDGVPLDLASALLPWKTRMSFGLGLHIHTHAGAQKRYAGQGINPSQVSNRKVTRMAFLGLIDSLETSVRKLEWKPEGTEWADYYDITNYSQDAFNQKKALVRSFLEQTHPGIVWDLGANTGEFSQIGVDLGAYTVAMDVDPSAVEKGYQAGKAAKNARLLPLLMDLTSPTPSLGWQNRERMSLTERAPADAVLALAIIHHLSISNNVPLPSVAEYFSQLGRSLIIEFVPKSDTQVQKLLASRVDIFDHYTQPDFEAAFAQYFTLRQSQPIPGTQRTLYLYETR